MDGLEKIVSMRGGMQALTSNWLLCRIIHWYDIESASFNGFQPRFSPNFSPSAARVSVNRSEQGSYFDSGHTAPDSLSLILDQSYFATFSRLVDLSSRLEANDPNCGQFLNSSELFDHRASVNYNLLESRCLCGHDTSHICVCEVCRLAIQVYLHLPLPKVHNGKHPISKLVVRLRTALGRANDLLIKYPTLLFWALFVGGIAAGSTLRLWFVASLARVVVSLEVNLKADARNSLLTICWTNRVCKVSALILWADINLVREVMQK